MTLTLGLTAALSGLQTSQRGIDLTSHNIANVNTEGYTRKIFNQRSLVLDGRGVGVMTGEIQRNVDFQLLKNLRTELSTQAELETKDKFFARVQDIFGRPSDNISFAHSINDLQTAFEQLATETGDLTAQNNVVLNAVTLVDQVSRMSQQVQQLRLEVDQEIESGVKVMQDLLDRIDTLNEQIIKTNTTGLGSGDLEDQRDQALNELSKLIDITYFERDGGEVIVLTKSGTSLVDTEPATVSHLSLTQSAAQLTYEGGDITPIYIGGVDVTNQLREGRLKSLVELRDRDLVDLQAELDTVVDTMRVEVNRAHNRSVSYPPPDELTGTRTFIDSSVQEISLSGAETHLMLFDAQGHEIHRSTLSAEMAASGAGAQPWTIDEVANGIQAWMNGNGAGNATVMVNGEGKFEIKTNDSNVRFAIQDRATIIPGSEAKDASVAFNADGDGGGNIDETVDGFANFLGLNDFFAPTRNRFIHDSNIVDLNYTTGMATTLTLTDQTNFPPPGSYSVNVPVGSSVNDIAAAINDDLSLQGIVSAQVLREGTGERLRIIHETGEELVVSEVGGRNILDVIGMEASSVAVSTDIKIRNDIFSDPALIAQAQVQYDTESGEYYVSEGDNSGANALSGVFTANHVFEASGALASGNTTLAQYAASIIDLQSTKAGDIETRIAYQSNLVESLEVKNAEISAVNLDQELSQLILFQQAYQAAARVISTTQELFNTLNSLVR